MDVGNESNEKKQSDLGVMDQKNFPETVGAAWDRAVSLCADQRSLCTTDGEFTYREVDVWSAHVAQTLRSYGVARSTRVALALENSAHHLAVLLGASRLGAVLVPLDPTSADDELVELLHRSGSEYLVCTGDRLTRLRSQYSDLGVLPLELDQVGAWPDTSVTTPVTPDPGLSGDDLWAIMYTSGSTSKPRGVKIRQRTFAITGAALSDALGYLPHDTVLSVLPLHHASSMIMSWAPAVFQGSAFALSDKFSRSGFWDFVRFSGSTVMTTVPTILEMLLTLEPGHRDRDHKLRLVATHRRIGEFVERFGTEIRSIWGMTETGGLGCVQRPGADPHSIGRSYPPEAQVRLVDSQEKDVAIGDVGELWFRHSGVMEGYLGEEPPRDGWIASGDLVTEISHGELRYVGRVKNMIKRGGENISLEEIEHVLFEHPLVEEVLVVPVPDRVYVEEACAVVVWVDDEPRVDELRAHCAERMAPWKEPRYFFTWQGSLPKLANQKTNRQVVKEGVDFGLVNDKLGEHSEV